MIMRTREVTMESLATNELPSVDLTAAAIIKKRHSHTLDLV